eukprot:1194623-Prorocentrum_minimum.AAC.5
MFHRSGCAGSKGEAPEGNIPPLAGFPTYDAYVAAFHPLLLADVRGTLLKGWEERQRRSGHSETRSGHSFRLAAVQSDLDGLSAMDLTDLGGACDLPRGSPDAPFAVEDMVLVEDERHSGTVFCSLGVVYEQRGGKLFVKVDPARGAHECEGRLKVCPLSPKTKP